MKKVLAILISSIYLFGLPLSKTEAIIDDKPSDKLLTDTLITTLDPHIRKAITEHHKNVKTYATYNMSYGLYDINILNIEREAQGGYSFLVTLTLRTFEHAHNPPNFKETITFRVNPSGIQMIELKHEVDDTFLKIEGFYEEVISEIKNSYQLNLAGFSRYNLHELQVASNQQAHFAQVYYIAATMYHSLSNEEERKPPLTNLIDPITYIKGDKGYILFKKADGTNVVYTIKKQGYLWKMIETQQKPGKKMKKELLWYI